MLACIINVTCIWAFIFYISCFLHVLNCGVLQYICFSRVLWMVKGLTEQILPGNVIDMYKYLWIDT